MPAAVAAAVSVYSAYRADKESQRQNKKAKEARRQQTAWREQDLEYQKEQDSIANERYQQELRYRQEQDAKREEQARQEKLRRDGLLSQMLSDAQLTDDELTQALDTSQADVTQAFGARRSALNRDLSKNFVDPSSGRARALNAELDISEAMSKAGSRNTTRNTLRQNEQQNIASVRSSALNLNDPMLNVLGSPLTAGGFNQPVAGGYGGAIGRMADFWGDNARFHQGQAGAYDRATGEYLNSIGGAMGYYYGYNQGGGGGLPQQSTNGQWGNGGNYGSNAGYGGHPNDIYGQEA
jgi:hypothetical protein